MHDDALIPERVLCGMEVRSRKHALEMLSSLLAQGPTRRTPAELYTDLSQRERLGCTALGNGVALPHARDAELDHPFAAMLLLATPVDFDAGDDTEVDVIVGVLLPEDGGQALLNSLSATLRRPDCLAMLQRARSAEDATAILMARLTDEGPAAAAG
jgi:PTS system nitrogen regulatory IIA component